MVGVGSYDVGMKMIWKYDISEESTVDMPEGAQILDVQMQRTERPPRSSACVWALVDPDRTPVKRALVLYGTGHPLPDDPGAYVGTFQVAGGSLVWHLFDATPR